MHIQLLLISECCASALIFVAFLHSCAPETFHKAQFDTVPRRGAGGRTGADHGDFQNRCLFEGGTSVTYGFTDGAGRLAVTNGNTITLTSDSGIGPFLSAGRGNGSTPDPEALGGIIIHDPGSVLEVISVDSATAGATLEVEREGGADGSFGFDPLPDSAGGMVSASHPHEQSLDRRPTATDALDVLPMAMGLESSNAPRWVFSDALADLSDAARGSVPQDSGLPATGAEIALTSILLGHLSEFA